jgi:hypothetical protein
MSPKGKLPPPRGAEQTRAAMLSSRFTTPETETDTAATPVPPEATPPAKATQPTAPSTGKRPTSRTPSGMVRRSYYLSKETADQFDKAIGDLVEGTGGLLPRHEAAAALIAAGTGQADAVLAEVRQRLMANLQDQ